MLAGGKITVALSSVVPLAEAAAFTFGCAMLRVRRFDPELVGKGLVLVAAALTLVLLIVLTPEGIVDASALIEPDEIHCLCD